MRLKLTRPLAVLDLESTGLNPRYDRIVEIAVLKVMPDGTQCEYERRVNPERPIPRDAMAVHGITDADVATAPTFRDIAGEVCNFLRGCDLAGFSIRGFDLTLLAAELARVGAQLEPGVRVVDAKTVFHKREPRTLSAALRFYCGGDHTDAHSALGDVRATLAVIEGQLAHYPDLPNTVAELDAYCNPAVAGGLDPDGRLKWADGEVVINFGQKSGLSLRSLCENEPGYLRWILSKDFNDQVKAVVRDALAGRFPQAPDQPADAPASP